MLANIDHLFAFHIAREDARLLHELDGLAEEEVTNLDDFQCYVKLSLHGHRLPIFSLDLDAPPRPDAEGAQLVRLRSRTRDARPAGDVDELIRQTQARQKNANPATQRVAHGKEEDAGVKEEREGGRRCRYGRSGRQRHASPQEPWQRWSHSAAGGAALHLTST